MTPRAELRPSVPHALSPERVAAVMEMLLASGKAGASVEGPAETAAAQ